MILELPREDYTQCPQVAQVQSAWQRNSLESWWVLEFAVKYLSYIPFLDGLPEASPSSLSFCPWHREDGIFLPLEWAGDA